MIAFLDGILEEKQPTRVTLNVGGVGHEVFIPLSSFDRLPSTGARCRLLTHDHVREDARQLYGFTTAAERRAFELLIGVSGIGPRTALSALSGLSPRELAAAIVEGDVKRLSSISGIGKKTAERIVVELRDKLTAGEALEAVAGAPEEASAGDIRRRDALSALVALGYKQADAIRMLAAAVPADADGLSVEDLVRRALTGR
jgi:Holliday junction DNA helicase RuvA